MFSFLYARFKRNVISCFHVHCFREVAKAVARLIALALDLDVHFFDTQEMLGEAIATLRLLHYDGQILIKSFGALL